jgi:hypothetical protein
MKAISFFNSQSRRNVIHAVAWFQQNQRAPVGLVDQPGLFVRNQKARAAYLDIVAEF